MSFLLHVKGKVSIKFKTYLPFLLHVTGNASMKVKTYLSFLLYVKGKVSMKVITYLSFLDINFLAEGPHNCPLVIRQAKGDKRTFMGQ